MRKPEKFHSFSLACAGKLGVQCVCSFPFLIKAQIIFTQCAPNAFHWLTLTPTLSRLISWALQTPKNSNHGMQPPKQKVKLIMPVGLGAKETQTIRTLCWLSSSRLNAFQLHQGDVAPDIYVVDRDDPAAVEAHADLHALRPAPAIYLVAEGSPPSPDSLQRPFLPRQLLTALDEAIERADDFAETVISRFFHDATATVLVVDDSPTVRAQMEQLLKKLASIKQVHMKVDVAEDGDRAMQKINSKDYDIVFLDVVLPGMDGYQICRAIKKNKATKRTPVVMLTSKSSPFDRIKGSLAGCDTYLAKPTNIETLFGVLEKYLTLEDESASVGGSVISN